MIRIQDWQWNEVANDNENDSHLNEGEGVGFFHVCEYSLRATNLAIFLKNFEATPIDSIGTLMQNGIVIGKYWDFRIMSQNLTGAETKALTLLGSGLPNHVVAQATGLSDSRISQLLSEDWFKNQVTELKYKALIKHNDLDEKYDDIESDLAEKLKGQIGLMFRPMEIAKTLHMVNSLKRRGVSSPDSISTQQPALSLVMPTVIIQQFVKSGNNQVVEVDDTPLVTIQPGQLQRLHENGTQQGTALSASAIGAETIAETKPQTIANSASIAELKERLASLRARQNEGQQYFVANPT